MNNKIRKRKLKFFYKIAENELSNLKEKKMKDFSGWHSGNEKNMNYIKEKFIELFDFYIERKVLYLASNSFARKVINSLKKYKINESQINELVPIATSERLKDGSNFSSTLKFFESKMKKVKPKLASFLSPTDEEQKEGLTTILGLEGNSPLGFGTEAAGVVYTDKEGREQSVINDKFFIEENLSNLKVLFSAHWGEGELKRKLYALLGMARFSELRKDQLNNIISAAEATIAHEVGHVYDRATQNNAPLLFAKKLLGKYKIKTTIEGDSFVESRLDRILKWENTQPREYLTNYHASGQSEILVRIDRIKNWLFNSKIITNRNSNLTEEHIRLWIENRKTISPRLYKAIDWTSTTERKVAEVFNDIR